MMARLASVLYLVLCPAFLYCATQLTQAENRVTPTRHLREIVLGRCWDYQIKKFDNTLQKWKNCTRIWEALYRAFAYKNPCNLTFEDYKPYFEAVDMKENINKVLELLSDSQTSLVSLVLLLKGWVEVELVPLALKRIEVLNK